MRRTRARLEHLVRASQQRVREGARERQKEREKGCQIDHFLLICMYYFLLINYNFLLNIYLYWFKKESITWMSSSATNFRKCSPAAVTIRSGNPRSCSAGTRAILSSRSYNTRIRFDTLGFFFKEWLAVMGGGRSWVRIPLEPKHDQW